MSPIGIVVAAHGELSDSLVGTARLIIGELPAVETVNLDPTMNLESMVEALRSAIQAANSPDGTLLLLDLFGGTPCNAAALLMQELACLAITGVNLPMLLEVILLRETSESIQELANIAKQAGNSGIVDVRERFDSLNSVN